MNRHHVIAVSGLGSIGKQHVAAFRALPDVQVIAFDPAREFRESALHSGAVDRITESFDELLLCQPDALVIAAPDFAHLNQLTQSARMRIPTLVEKPLADSWGNALGAASALDRTGTPILVGYVLRYRRAVELVKRILEDGTIGTATSFQVMLGAYSTITSAVSRFSTVEPNRLYRDYSHEWDYLRWIFGPVKEVTALARTTNRVPHVESPNIVDGIMVMTDDVSGTFHIDYVDPCGTRTLFVMGTGGSIHADFSSGRVVIRTNNQPFEQVYSLAEPASAALTRQAIHLLAVADGRETPRVSLRDGLAALAVTDALIRSAADRSWTSVLELPHVTAS